MLTLLLSPDTEPDTKPWYCALILSLDTEPWYQALIPSLDTNFDAKP
ncbi:MAG: hypothetical protein ACI9WS_001684 [Paraglaciecola psychrophila]|jgi:hypothetical protein